MYHKILLDMSLKTSLSGLLNLTDLSESTDSVDFKALRLTASDILWLFVSLIAFSLGEPWGVAMGVAAVCVMIGGFLGPAS